ncbi:ABC transporter ATP-binding protein [Neobacillus niacini]|uniref:ABC transporter ATP-binding protein n=1 Tax=Neobacillus niacini TaxID=86668 RepID=UPI0021CB5873|nr:ABC transporter ATP-binding protein [Neobacillus niacini]MCM3764763.1 ABC transporter ATP-binding protein [Neobacillus niacini]
MTGSVLEVKDLRTSFFTPDGEIPAVDGVKFHLKEGEILGIVGESGCGKSVTSLSIMGLVPAQNGKIVGGEILFRNEDLTKVSAKRMREIRGNDIAMIYQEPMSSLNPVFTIGNQLMEAIRTHAKMSKQEALKMAVDILKRVGLPRAEELIHSYPHQLSGGMCQRVMIAMALVCEPQVLIADEPTTALDVTIQAQILDLMKKLNEELKTSIILITHDLGVVAEVCDRVAVMYAGKIVEEGFVNDIFQLPKHPYTIGLIKSIPDVRFKKRKLYSIPGSVPKPGTLKQGCLFAPRCLHAFDRCHKATPEMVAASPSHGVRCFLHASQEEGQYGGNLIKS